MRSINRTALAETALAIVLMGLATVIAGSARADETASAKGWATEVAPVGRAKIRITPDNDFQALRTRLDGNDRVAALEALQVALDEVGDGSTYVWRRKEGLLGGMVKPTASFRDAKGAVCRHLILKLTLGDASRQVEGIACRDADDRWRIDG